jgi:hypothetical protein
MGTGESFLGDETAKVSRNTAKVSSTGERGAATTDMRASSYKWFPTSDK